jgi:hypothetical protein
VVCNAVISFDLDGLREKAFILHLIRSDTVLFSRLILRAMKTMPAKRTGSPLERWWPSATRGAMAAIVALGLIPALLLRRSGAKAASVPPLAANPQPS